MGYQLVGQNAREDKKVRAGWSELLVLGMVTPPFIGNPGILIMGPYKPLRTWVDEFIPYYMEIMGV